MINSTIGEDAAVQTLINSLAALQESRTSPGSGAGR
jgi:hypothetical protein